MRKRSGGLHSDSEEQFLLLAEYANQKNGYFYDESLHNEISAKLSNNLKQPINSKSAVFSHNFMGFDFGTEDIEKKEELEQLQASSKTIQMNFAIICNHLTIIQKLQELWPGKGQTEIQPQQQRLIDLYILKINGSNHLYCFKFWLVEPKNNQNLICGTYLKRAQKIINFDEVQSIGEKWSFQEAKGIIFSLVNSSMR